MSFIVYSKDGCPHCTKVVQLLQLSEMRHVEYKLERDFTKNEFIEEFGQGSTFPQVVVDDTRIGGCTETVEYLRERKII